LAKIFIILIMLLAISSASSCVQNAGEEVIASAGWIIGIAAMLTTMVIAAAYMYGSVKHDANSLVFAKDELFHLGVSIVLVVAVSGIISSACLVTNYMFQMLFGNSLGLCGGPDADLISMQSCVISGPLGAANSITADFSKMEIENMMYSSWFYTYAVPFSDMVTTVTSAFMKTYAMQLETITNVYMLPVLTSLKLQQIVLNLAARFSITLILPAGFVFRLIPPLRRFGNFLLALSFGLYVILPFFTIFNYSTFNASARYCSKYQDALSDTVMGSNGTTYGYGSTCGGTHEHGFWTVASLIAQAFFLPNLTLALFVTYISAMNKALSVIG